MENNVVEQKESNKGYSVVPLTKIIASVLFSFCAVVLTNPYHLAILALIELLILLVARQLVKQGKTLVAFIGFAFFLGLIQFVVTHNIASSFESGLRMFCMAIIFLLLIVTTKLQDLTTALVDQCKIPYEYAFMLTASLRFIPDFIEESKAVREAQLCRGMNLEGNIVKKISSYLSVVQPLVLRSLGKSETMALSLELRGFGSSAHAFSNKVNMKALDYLLTFLMMLGTLFVLYVRVHM